MLVSDFDFDLPEALIAQQARPRGTSRLLAVDRAAQSWQEHTIAALPSLLRPGDLIVANDTRVFPARLIGRREPGGGAAECLLLDRTDAAEWMAMVRPGQRIKPGAEIVFEDATRAPGVRLIGEVGERQGAGERRVRLVATGAADVDAAIDALGHIPLPPYIRREDTEDDRHRYQTVYARARGSIAAPTAGLHFDQALVDATMRAGIGWTSITLHVGYGTFKPVRVERVADHQVDAERFTISPDAASRIAEARAAGGRIVAIGTTTTRALESAAASDGVVRPGEGRATIFIHPGVRFGVVDALLTNFHLPRSSLLMLVAAFAGTEFTLAAYREAVARQFHFYSYGDAMLVT